MKLIVSLLFYNSLPGYDSFITHLLDSLPDINMALHIVDNGSNDGTLEKIKETDFSQFKQIKIDALPQNLGCVKGWNSHFRYARDNDYDYMLLLTDDAIVHKGFFEKMVHQMAAHKLNAITSWEPWCDVRLPSGAIEWTAWVGVLFKLQAVRDIGVLNEKFTHCGQDIEYSLRTWDHGWRVVACENNGEIEHIRFRPNDNVVGINCLWDNARLTFLGNNPQWHLWRAKNRIEDISEGWKDTRVPLEEVDKVDAYYDCRENVPWISGHNVIPWDWETYIYYNDRLKM